ncbi:VOC family protein [Ekhidna sp.]
MNKDSSRRLAFFATTILISYFGVGQKLSIDHIIVVGKDLDKMVQEYEEKGFHIKSGRLHDNGLRNAHIKFSNESSLELMTVIGEPKDPIASTYNQLIKKNIKGAYIALTGVQQDRIESALNNLDYEYQIVKNKLWTYVTFPENSDFAHIFFIIYHKKLTETDYYTTHSNGAIKFQSVTISGSDRLFKFLDQFSIESSTSLIRTPTGDILLQDRPKGVRPAIMQVIFDQRNGEELLLVLDN